VSYKNSALLLLLLAAPARAISNTAGTSGAQFLKLGAGARAAGMGDAFTAVADDAFAAYYNPAGLARMARPQIGASHSAMFQGVSYQSLSFVAPFGRAEGRGRIETEGNKHALGVSVYYLGVADVERRTGDSTNAVGTFSAGDSAYALSYAYAHNDKLSLGVNGKYLHQTIDNYSGSAMAADLGVLYRLNPNGQRPVSLAASLRQLGNGIGYAGQKDPLPTTVVVAAAVAPTKNSVIDLDLGKTRDSAVYASLGGEARRVMTDGITGALRAGYTSSKRDNGGLAGLSAGGGLAFPKAEVDVAWIPFGSLGDTFRFSLLIKF